MKTASPVPAATQLGQMGTRMKLVVTNEQSTGAVLAFANSSMLKVVR